MSDARLPDDILDRARHRLVSDPVPPSESVPEEVRRAEREEGRDLGAYVLVERVGRGGAGDVWRSWDRELRRWVAVKLLRSESPEIAERFLNEAQLAGRLHHPGIIRIHGVGRHRDGTFLVMQYVEEAKEPLTIRRSIEVVCDAARAIHHAHENGILHRDVKPGNLLIDRTGKAVVTDFGLARRLNTPAGATVPGAVLGTPTYMAPEQARGEREKIGPASDVYSLGATLYEFCTGSLPYSGEDAGEVLAQVLSGPPPVPRSRKPSLHRDVEAIILKATARDPRERYPSALALAEDLDRFLGGESIRARPASLSTRVRGWFRRNRRVAGLLAAAGTVTAGAVVVGAVLYRRSLGLERESAVAREREARRARASDALRPAVQALDLWETWNAEVGAEDQRIIERSIEGSFRHEMDFGPAWLQEGRRQWRRLDLEGAEEAFSRALEDPSSKGEAHYYRARIRIARFLRGRPLPGVSVGSGGTEIRPLFHTETKEERRLREGAILDLESSGTTGSGGDDPRAPYARSLIQLVSASDRREFLKVAEGMSGAIESLRVPRWEGCYLQGLAWYFGGEYARAVESFDRAIEAGRKDRADVWEDRARAILASKEQGTDRLTEALRSVDEALKRDGNAPDVWYLRGIIYGIRARMTEVASDRDSAIESFSKSLSLDARLAEVWYNRAVTRAERGERADRSGGDPRRDYQEAVSDFGEALARNEEYDEALTYRGITYKSLALAELRRNGDPKRALEAAVEDAARGLEKNPDSRLDRLNRGILQVLRGDIVQGIGGDPHPSFEGAETDFRRLLEADADDAEARLELGRLNFIRRRWREAIADLERARELSPVLATECEKLIRQCKNRDGEE